MVKHFELAKFTEKSVLLEHFLDFLAKYLPLWFSLGLQQIGSIV